MKNHPHWLHQAAPRYTSYPSAHHFTPAVNQSMHHLWLHEIEEKTTISIYVHIPFCRALCWFCGCHTHITRHDHVIARYVDLLLQEIELLKTSLAGKGQLVNIHFGGGSPSLLRYTDLDRLLSSIHDMFHLHQKGEWAIELDPRTTSMEHIEYYKTLGFNRVSLGIQDFDLTVQQHIHRIQPYKMVNTLMEHLRQANIHHINCDLIYGLPGQTIQSFQDLIQKIIDLSPDTIALFSYAHMPQIKKHQRMIDDHALPGAKEKLMLYMTAVHHLEKAGYISIGIDHFAKSNDALAIAWHNGTLRRNFQGYVTDRSAVLLGLGASSISQFTQGYIQNTPNIKTYTLQMRQKQLATTRGWVLSLEDQIRKMIIEQLMCFMSVDLMQIIQQFSLPNHFFQRELNRLQTDDFQDIVKLDGQYIQITTPLRMAARLVAAVFDVYYEKIAQGQCSKVV